MKPIIVVRVSRDSEGETFALHWASRPYSRSSVNRVFVACAPKWVTSDVAAMRHVVWLLLGSEERDLRIQVCDSVSMALMAEFELMPLEENSLMPKEGARGRII